MTVAQASSTPGPLDVGSVRSMTGQGHAAGSTELGTVSIEIRTVNNRGFKCSIRAPESLSGIDSKIESVVRQSVRRGSVTVSFAIERDAGQTPVRVNDVVLSGYIRQCRAAIDQAGADADPTVILNVAALTSLPGVLSGDRPQGDTADKVWQQVRSVLSDALDNLVAMRQREGGHMAETLSAECTTIEKLVRSIEKITPLAAENYRSRLESKVKRLLAEFDAEVGPVDLLREVQIYADKSDVSEEITRLDSHLALFRSVLTGAGTGTPADATASADEPMGRKLDFIIQEMFRETNTIGSKSAQSDVSAYVVEIKCAIERMRELVQNLE